MSSQPMSAHAIFKKYKARLKKLDTPHFCDVSERVQVLHNQIRPLAMGLKMVGIAHTVESRGDLLAMFAALKVAGLDEVLMVSGGGPSLALAGELMATEAKRKKLAGIVIDGGCRDVDMIPKIKLPFYASFVCPQAGPRMTLGRTQVTITCGGVAVCAGDIVIGDDNGVIVIPLHELEDIVELAEARRENEKIALKKMHAGMSLLDMLNLDEHVDNIKQGKQSKLVFNPQGRK